MENQVTKRFADHYKNMVDWVNWQIDDLSEAEMQQTVAPGTNHGIWLLGHLIVSDDDLGAYLGIGEKQYPDLFPVYGQGSKCKPPSSYHSLSELKAMWKAVSDRNIDMLSQFSDDELDKPHAQVKDPDRDFFKTKFRVISFWILHQQYHAGQLGLLNAVMMKKRPVNTVPGVA
ncbi:MAG: DinB family protein [bacterium]|nr:DinB family protein [bacterium]